MTVPMRKQIPRMRKFDFTEVFQSRNKVVRIPAYNS